MARVSFKNNKFIFELEDSEKESLLLHAKLAMKKLDEKAKETQVVSKFIEVLEKGVGEFSTEKMVGDLVGYLKKNYKITTKPTNLPFWARKKDEE